MYATMNSTEKKSSLLFHFYLPLLVVLSLQVTVQLSAESDTIFRGQTLSGNHTITSKGGIFELGFFSPIGNSPNYYLGIWYKESPLANRTVVWVANRDHPVSDPYSSSLEFSQDGTLVLHTPDGLAAWSTNLNSGTPTPLPNSTVGVLGDDGNFMIRESYNSSIVLWQSFEHPTDTWLPGAKFGHDNLTGITTILQAWKDKETPAPGLFSAELTTSLEILLKNGSKTYQNKSYKFFEAYTAGDFSNETSSYLVYSIDPGSGFVRYVLDITGQLKKYVWRKYYQRWELISTLPPQVGVCDDSLKCGLFAICDEKSVVHCLCLKGFHLATKKWVCPGCVRVKPLECINDTFYVIPNVRYPQGPEPESFEVKSSEECRLACLSNCSCSAYAYMDRCLNWEGSLYTIKQLSSDEEIGGDLYVRVAASEMESESNNKKTPFIAIAGAIAVLVPIFGLTILLKLIWRKGKVSGGSFDAMDNELIHFKYQGLRKATKNFRGKIGQGGFGTVYKGEFPNSTPVAVKELSSSLMQGEKQFRAELSTLGVIQHRNLVRLRGFCSQDSKKFLVYDYMPNGSLASHLFEKDSDILDWGRRYRIALGSAKGLAYLHEECRDSIIHCDIKPENILLDGDYNPRVADFGLAKLLCRNFSRVLTTVRGTRGYLAPEWFSGEPVTEKVDVYSYGQVLFEIISGRRNMDILDTELNKYFPLLVLNALNNGAEVLTLVDSKLEGEVNVEELIRACKVASWCIQDDEKDRPTMKLVIQILEGTLDVGIPPIPRFFQSIAQASMKESIMTGTEAYSSTSSSLPTSFTFQL